MAARYGYRRFDGSGDDDELDAEALLEALTDDLLEGGDLSDALNNLLRRGMRTDAGERLEGLQKMMERARRRRQELLERGDPDEQFAEFRDRLDDVERTEREALDALTDEAASSGDERRQQVTDDVVAERSVALDVMPDRFADRVDAMQHYEFVSSEAREQFEQLLAELRDQLLGSYFESLKGALSEPDPAQLARLREGMDALSRMLEQRERGEDLDPTFEEFMAQYGDLFGPADTLDELLENLARRMAAARAMFDSLSPDQRAELERLARSLFEDMDLNFAMSRLAANLSRAFPEFDSSRGYAFEGEGPLSLTDATDAASQLGDLERLEELLGSDNPAAALPEIDLDAVRRNLGEDAARSLDRLSRLVKELSDAGLIERRAGRLELTAHGVRRLGARALADLFDRLRATVRSASTPRCARATATTARRSPSPGRRATRSTCTSLARSTTRSHARARACPCTSSPRTSRSWSTRRSCARRPCSRSTCRCRCRCGTTSCRRRRWPSPSRRSSARGSRATSCPSWSSPRSRGRSRSRSSRR